MSLHDAIKNLHGVAKIFDNATFKVDMSALENFVDGLGKIKPVNPPPDVVKITLEKFLRGDFDFSRREVKALPSIIFDDAITVDGAKKILRLINFQRTNTLRNVASIYLMNYDDSGKTELLRKILLSVRNDSPQLRKIFAAREYLFGDNRHANMTWLLTQTQSVDGAFDIIGLGDYYKTSKFIHAALKNFFRHATPLDVQLKILDEIDADYETYQNIFVAVADELIPIVDRAGLGKKKCADIFYNRLGDPRFGDGRFNWYGVTEKSRGIFLRWLVENDLEIFFKIIKQTAVDRMWRYREKFWRAYLPHISNTWIFLGDAAKRLARQLGDETLAHDTLVKATDDQSVLVFQIGEYIFSEWSHNGKLRVHEASAKNFFGLPFISRTTITKNFVAEWIHSSPQIYLWQKKVSEWLKVKCRVNKTRYDWGLEN